MYFINAQWEGFYFGFSASLTVLFCTRWVLLGVFYRRKMNYSRSHHHCSTVLSRSSQLSVMLLALLFITLAAGKKLSHSSALSTHTLLHKAAYTLKYERRTKVWSIASRKLESVLLLYGWNSNVSRERKTCGKNVFFSSNAHHSHDHLMHLYQKSFSFKLFRIEPWYLGMLMG